MRKRERECNRTGCDTQRLREKEVSKHHLEQLNVTTNIVLVSCNAEAVDAHLRVCEFVCVWRVSVRMRVCDKRCVGCL